MYSSLFHCRKAYLFLALGWILTTACDDSHTAQPDDPMSIQEMTDEIAQLQEEDDTENTLTWTVRAEGPIALLDGDPVASDLFDELVATINEPRTKMPEPALQRFIDQTLDIVIETALMDRAVKQSDVTIDESEVERQVDELKHTVPNGMTIDDMLPDTDDNLNDLRARIRRELIIEELSRDYPSARPTLGFDNGDSFLEHLQQTTEIVILRENLVIEPR